jgi:hypothetical protein
MIPKSALRCGPPPPVMKQDPPVARRRHAPPSDAQIQHQLNVVPRLALHLKAFLPFGLTSGPRSDLLAEFFDERVGHSVPRLGTACSRDALIKTRYQNWPMETDAEMRASGFFAYWRISAWEHVRGKGPTARTGRCTLKRGAGAA